MTKDNWIKAFREKFRYWDLTAIDDLKEVESFISQVEKDAIEKTNKRWRERIEEKIDYLTAKQGLLSSLTVKNVLSDLLEDK